MLKSQTINEHFEMSNFVIVVQYLMSNLVSSLASPTIIDPKITLQWRNFFNKILNFDIDTLIWHYTEGAHSLCFYHKCHYFS